VRLPAILLRLIIAGAARITELGNSDGTPFPACRHAVLARAARRLRPAKAVIARFPGATHFGHFFVDGVVARRYYYLS
jgi:hypothetical protein